MEPISGPDAKKARWSPTSAYAAQNNGSNTSNTSSRDAFANYGYGPQATISSSFNTAPGGPTSNGTATSFASSPLYSTPSLSVNTQSNGAIGMNSQMSPNTAAAFAVQQQQQQHQLHQAQSQQQQQQAQGSPNGNYSPFNAYNMLSMGMPSMGILSPFSYNNQMGNFAQVSSHPLYC